MLRGGGSAAPDARFESVKLIIASTFPELAIARYEVNYEFDTPVVPHIARFPDSFPARFPFASLDPRDAPFRSYLFLGAADHAFQSRIDFRIALSASQPAQIHLVPLDKPLAGSRYRFN
jgi:hypothetical protein